MWINLPSFTGKHLNQARSISTALPTPCNKSIESCRSIVSYYIVDKKTDVTEKLRPKIVNIYRFSITAADDCRRHKTICTNENNKNNKNIIFIYMCMCARIRKK